MVTRFPAPRSSRGQAKPPRHANTVIFFSWPVFNETGCPAWKRGRASPWKKENGRLSSRGILIPCPETRTPREALTYPHYAQKSLFISSLCSGFLHERRSLGSYPHDSGLLHGRITLDVPHLPGSGAVNHALLHRPFQAVQKTSEALHGALHAGPVILRRG